MPFATLSGEREDKMAPSPDETSRSVRPLLALACWAALFLLYELLAGSPSGPEMAAGALAALVATVSAFGSGDRDHLGRMRWGWWWLLVRRVAPSVVPDTIRVLAASVAPSRPAGRFRPLAFEPGGDDAVSGSRRALVVLGASVAPNGYVVAIDDDEEALLTHELVPREAPPGRGDPRWPL